MLREIAIVTLTVNSLGTTENAWQTHLDYEVSGRGTVSTEVADLLQARNMAGSAYVLMKPANGAPVYIRFIEDREAPLHEPMTSHGWTVTELLVADTDAVADRLRESDFRIIGEPKDLWPAPDAPRAMQAVGPGNELLYLTTNNPAAQALELGKDMPLVERAFIMVAGGPSMTDLLDFYGETLGLEIDPPQPFQITTISKANNLPLDTTYPLAIVRLAPGYLLELDEMPSVTGPKPQSEGRLPPGIGAVGFTVSRMPTSGVEWVSEPRPVADAPYNGRETGLIRGPAGELIELLLTPVE